MSHRERAITDGHANGIWAGTLRCAVHCPRFPVPGGQSFSNCRWPKTGKRQRGQRSAMSLPVAMRKDDAAPTALGRIELNIPIKFSTRFGNGRILREVKAFDWVGQHVSLK